MIRIVLVDDHRLVRRGLRSFLETVDDLEIAGEASSGEELLAQVSEWLPDVAVVDLLLPGGIDGIETTRRLRALSPHTQVVILTAQADEARLLAALRAGALGYVRKEAEPEALLAAIRAAAQGQSMLDPLLAGEVLQELNRKNGLQSDNLTEREMEVLQQLALGHTNRQIAEALTVSEETVKTHVGNILAKLQLNHRTQAVLYALKQGLVSLDEIDISSQ